MWRYDLLYIVGIYIVVPTIENYIAILSASDCVVIPFVVDCIVIFLQRIASWFIYLLHLFCLMCYLVYVPQRFAFEILHKDLPYTFHLKIWVMLFSELLYNVRTYIVIPTINNYIVSSSVEDYNVILATGDCLTIPVFASSTCLMFYLIQCT